LTLFMVEEMVVRGEEAIRHGEIRFFDEVMAR